MICVFCAEQFSVASFRCRMIVIEQEKYYVCPRCVEICVSDAVRVTINKEIGDMIDAK